MIIQFFAKDPWSQTQYTRIEIVDTIVNEILIILVLCLGLSNNLSGRTIIEMVGLTAAIYIHDILLMGVARMRVLVEERAELGAKLLSCFYISATIARVLVACTFVMGVLVLKLPFPSLEDILLGIMVFVLLGVLADVIKVVDILFTIKNPLMAKPGRWKTKLEK